MDLADSLLDLHYVNSRSRANSRCSSLVPPTRRRSYIGSRLSLYSNEHRDRHTDSQQPYEQDLYHNEPVHDTDGGTAWLCVAGSLLANMLIGGIEKSFGIMFIVIQEDFNASAVETSWIGSLASTLRFLCGVISGMLVGRFGCRRLTLVGSALYVSGMLASTFAKRTWILYLSYGVCTGVGASFIYISSTLVIAERFSRLRARAIGLALAGSGLGSFCFPLLMQYLLENYGYFGEMLIMTGIVCNYFVAATFYKPLQQLVGQSDSELSANSLTDSERELHLKLNSHIESDIESGSESEKSRVAQFRDCIKDYFGCGSDDETQEGGPSVGFLLLCMALCFVFMGYLAALFFLPSLAISRGVSSSSAAFLLSVVGISDMMGRITSGLIFDLEKCVPWRKRLYGMTFLTLGVVNLLVPFCQQYYQFIICAMFTGYFAGVCVAQRAVICMETVGEDLMKKFYGLLVTSQGVGVLVGPAIASALREKYHCYSSSYYFCGIVQLVAALLFSIELMLDCRSRCAAQTADEEPS